MPNQNLTSRSSDDINLMSLIAKRAKSIFPNISVLEFIMYINCMHKQMELDLNGLLSSEYAHFLHDITGIVNNTDTDKEKVDSSFKPFFVKGHHVLPTACLANMRFPNGSSDWLEVNIFYNANNNEECVRFVRKDGVHAWHCDSLPLSDKRILEIKQV